MDLKEESREADSDEDTPGQAPAAVQQMQGRGANNRYGNRPQRGPRVLSDEQMRIVWERNLCLQCYKPGHHRGDESCQEKGKPRRKPLPGELKA
jgi:hypothetical protein